MIEVNNLFLTIKKVPILVDINTSFERGKIHGLIGRNGSGKTMLMKCICGFVKPTTERSPLTESVSERTAISPKTPESLSKHPVLSHIIRGTKI